MIMSVGREEEEKEWDYEDAALWNVISINCRQLVLFGGSQLLKSGQPEQLWFDTICTIR